MEQVIAILKELVQKVGAIEGRLDTIEGRLDTLDGRMDSMESRMTAMEGRMDAMEGRMDVMQEDVADIKEGLRVVRTNSNLMIEWIDEAEHETKIPFPVKRKQAD